MSNGIDNLATGAMTGNGPEVAYAGQNLAGDLSMAPDMINIDGIAQVVDTGAQVSGNVESLNDLGVDRTMDVQSSQKGN